ncbi:MAG: PDZ domain-containing protein [Clostridia bacterium]|nr:PDZ domain-containing protein [Clostridia bacterium]
MEYEWQKNEKGEYSVKTAKKKRNTALYIIIAVLFVILIAVALISTLFFQKVIKSDPVGVAIAKNLPAATVEVSDEDLVSVSEKVKDSLVTLPSVASDGGFFGYSMPMGGGTGIVVTEDGYIVTTIGAVSGMPEITVIIGDEELPCDVISVDNSTGIVLLKVDKQGLKPISFASSEGIMDGVNVAVVLRNPVQSLGTTMSIGTVAGVNKDVGLSTGGTVNIFQIDSSLSLNDGAVILDKEGKLIGVTTTVVSSGIDGIGIAIPSNDVLNSISSYTGGSAGSGLMIGITGTGSEHGVVVESVEEDSSAEKAGIEPGDLIMKADGEAVKAISDINRIKETHKKGDKMTFSILRDGEVREIAVVLG